MYTIKIDNDIVFASSLADAGYVIFNGILKKKINSVDALEFTIPDTNPSYSKVTPLKGVIRVYNNSDIVFRGRVMEATRNLYGQKEVHCESDVSRLNDVQLRPYVWNGTPADYLTAVFTACINKLGVKAPRLDSTFTANAFKCENESYSSCMDEIQRVIMGRTEEVYMLTSYDEDYAYVSFQTSLTSVGDQTVEFGRNMLDLSDFIDGSLTATQIIPLGESVDTPDLPEPYPSGWTALDSNKLTIKSVNSNNDYLLATFQSYDYGIIEKVVEWPEELNATNLKDNGNAELNRLKKLVHSITLTAIDLSQLDVNVSALELGKLYYVVSPAHGYYYGDADSLFPLSQIDINLDDPTRSVYTFGKTKKTLTGA